MALPAPNLDDRSFDDIVNDVKRQIARRCPEWTEHNASDPGVTLIELFAWMTEMMLYRLNQVPEKNYIKFLDMLGVSLEPPAPASTAIRFDLTRPIDDNAGDESYEVTLPARRTVAATVRTETEEAIEFATDADLRLVRPRLTYIMAVSRPDTEADTIDIARDFVPEHGHFPIFDGIPRQSNALYLGFEADISGNIVRLKVRCVSAAATGLDEEYPAQLWEFWNRLKHCWERLEVIADTTVGFNTTGSIQLLMPQGLHSHMLGQRRAYWVRCRYTLEPADLPPRGPQQLRPSTYLRSPEIIALQAQVVGGITTASNCINVLFAAIGQSDGTPGQVFTLSHKPVLARRTDETILIGEQGKAYEAYTAWTEVTDFSQSGPRDRHFILDSLTGEVSFGPNILQPDGSTWQYGAIPAKGLTIIFSAYRYGGGIQGNVKENQLRILKSSIPYIAGVNNPERARGGRNQETMERAKMRGRAVLRMRERAVTCEDYEFLARRASSHVGRARCVQPIAMHMAEHKSQYIPPGLVRVLIVPTLREDLLVPHPHDLCVTHSILDEVYSFLDDRRLLTTVLEVSQPRYLYVSTDIVLVADPRADADLVARRVQEQLSAYIHPLYGGPQREGWPFQHTLTLADVYAQVQGAHGVAFLLDARIAVSKIINESEGLFGPEQIVSNAEGVRISDDELLCTREHRIQVRPMWSVGLHEGI